ncbi:MAG: DNA-directed RNA polymerase subunit alpha [Patescibacteria group bacterium]|jgi:DNA-directed RNA polymerase subunit alpha
MELISLPSKIDVKKTGDNVAMFTIEPCYPGYGMTLGNAMRRVLLSSLEGAAITAVKIEGVNHEFSTIPNVKEDVVEIILNLKTLRFRSFSDEPVTVKLSAKGEKKVTGKDIKATSDVEVVHPEQVIATLTDKAAELEMELKIEKGRGYVPVETREKEKREIGMIAVDAIFTPIRNVNFDVENVRVGQMTNYDRLMLEVITDGTLSPEKAFHEAAKLLDAHFNFLLNGLTETGKPAKVKAEEPEVTETAVEDVITDLAEPKKKRARAKKSETKEE